MWREGVGGKGTKGRKDGEGNERRASEGDDIDDTPTSNSWIRRWQLARDPLYTKAESNTRIIGIIPFLAAKDSRRETAHLAE